ncbi:hypothetical protein [Bradyrhizobium sp. sBnM-33]|uniref:hypothetical protein n=1 Tax=Bradyrhizobium sp. sBnM-33 TaxID=2831780 RepID=UPI001BCE0C38|nr:hypothetical protein [Bradyrhizobium sp. sBnM-33]WOH47320.1 hypothetical protein RX328_24320 [Bradyrhizobium sp. sBnM-33]
MRTSILLMMAAFGTALTMPALAQQSTAPGQQEVQTDKQMQEEADKGIKTRDSGQSGLVSEQEQPGASAHPPGQPNPSSQTTGSGAGTSGGAQGAAPSSSPR